VHIFVIFPLPFSVHGGKLPPVQSDFQRFQSGSVWFLVPALVSFRFSPAFHPCTDLLLVFNRTLLGTSGSARRT
jgi:hypothetical protein